MIPIEEVARLPRPGTAVPGGFAFSPDGGTLTWLHASEGGLRQQLHALDLASGAIRVLFDPAASGTDDANVSREEALRRERLRERAHGVTRYEWSKRGDLVLVPLPSGLHLVDPATGRSRLLADAALGATQDPRFSPDGTHVAFVRDAELHVVPVDGGPERQVTSGARGTGRTNGLAEYVAQEEMDRHEGYWWSRDGRFLAFEEVDETHVPVYRIVHQGKDAVGEAAQEDHRYPFAGAANARVRLGVVARDGSEPVWMRFGGDADDYLARVDWMPDGSLLVQVQDRRQTELRVVRLDPTTGEGVVLLRETSDVWINLHKMLRPLERGDAAGGFLWASERSGFRHLYVIAADGRVLRQLTDGEWVVDAVSGVDEERGLVWFLGSRDDPRQRQLYEVPLAGGLVRRVTPEHGLHDVKVDPKCRVCVDVHHAADRPPTTVLRSLDDGRVMRVLHDAATDPRIAELGLRPPELVTLESRDGVPLFGALYAPPASAGPGPYPAVISVYGGPHVQRVADSWEVTVEMRAQRLRERGYVVLVLDNRGSARRGLAFEGAIRHDMGNIEVRDQVDGVRWLVDRGLADPSRVGIYGWSYGGYMSAMCLARAPETFRCAVAGAPVSAWDGYDTHYTERYMGLPQENVDGYRQSAVMTHVGGIRGDLMLVHGLLDENVHFRHTARLVSALVRARKRHELLLFPDERHMPRGEPDRVYMEERISDFLDRCLRGV